MDIYLTSTFSKAQICEYDLNSHVWFWVPEINVMLIGLSISLLSLLTLVGSLSINIRDLFNYNEAIW